MLEKIWKYFHFNPLVFSVLTGGWFFFYLHNVVSRCVVQAELSQDCAAGWRRSKKGKTFLRCQTDQFGIKTGKCICRYINVSLVLLMFCIYKHFLQNQRLNKSSCVRKKLFTFSAADKTPLGDVATARRQTSYLMFQILKQTCRRCAK